MKVLVPSMTAIAAKAPVADPDYDYLSEGVYDYDPKTLIATLQGNFTEFGLDDHFEAADEGDLGAAELKAISKIRKAGLKRVWVGFRAFDRHDEIAFVLSKKPKKAKVRVATIGNPNLHKPVNAEDFEELLAVENKGSGSILIVSDKF